MELTPASLPSQFWFQPVGLVLSTPLTVCLLVIGRYVPPLKFLHVLLGDQEALPPAACYYQRLLALDEDEAQEVAETYLKEKTLEELYDELLIPALSLAEQDRHQHALDEDREKFIYQTTKDLIEEMAARSLTSKIETALSPDSQVTILCVPARDESDELVGLMVAQLLQHLGHNAKAIPIGTLETTLTLIKQSQPDVLFVSAFPPFGIGRARALCRRVRREFPPLKIVLGFWSPAADAVKIQERLGNDCVDYVVSNLRQAELQIPLVSSQIEPRHAEINMA